MEKVLTIEDTVFTREDRGYSHTYEGFVITTDQQVIKVGISNQSNCCEYWGHLASADDLSAFIGAELRSIAIVDTGLNEQVLNAIDEASLDEGGVMYVNLDTSAGILQLTAYNAHNGYYGHEAVVVSRQLAHEAYL